MVEDNHQEKQKEGRKGEHQQQEQQTRQKQKTQKKEEKSSEVSVDNGPSIRMVIQRYRQVSLLVDESHVVSAGTEIVSLLSDVSTDCVPDPSTKEAPSAGLLVYISFSKTANESTVHQAAQTVLNLPVLTLGAWGDGSAASSVLQLLTANSKNLLTSESKRTDEEQNSVNAALSQLSIALVPQANLIAKVKKNGKSIQYRDQIEKSIGKQLYECFVQSVNRMLVEHQGMCRDGEGKSLSEKSSKKKNNNQALDPSIKPDQLFRIQGPSDTTKSYGSFDGKGIPLAFSDGETLTKSARKKLSKFYNLHVKRHEKWIQKGEKTTKYTISKEEEEEQKKGKSGPVLDPSFARVFAGTFGMRQGVTFQSDMGPFCHVIEL